jgi:hypothetical protein
MPSRRIRRLQTVTGRPQQANTSVTKSTLKSSAHGLWPKIALVPDGTEATVPKLGLARRKRLCLNAYVPNLRSGGHVPDRTSRPHVAAVAAGTHAQRLVEPNRNDPTEAVRAVDQRCPVDDDGVHHRVPIASEIISDLGDRARQLGGSPTVLLVSSTHTVSRRPTGSARSRSPPRRFGSGSATAACFTPTARGYRTPADHRQSRSEVEGGSLPVRLTMPHIRQIRTGAVEPRKETARIAIMRCAAKTRRAACNDAVHHVWRELHRSRA